MDLALGLALATAVAGVIGWLGNEVWNVWLDIRKDLRKER